MFENYFNTAWSQVQDSLSQLFPLRPQSVVSITITIIFVLWALQKRYKLPPGPAHIPFLGNLLAFRVLPFEEKIIEWWKHFGPVFFVYLGSRGLLVVNDTETIITLLTDGGSTYAGRPTCYSKHRTTQGRKNLMSSPYDEGCKIRRAVAVKALGECLQDGQMEGRIGESLQGVMQYIDEEDSPFDPHNIISLYVFNVLHDLCFGTRKQMDDPFFKKILNIFDDARNSRRKGFLEDLFPPMLIWPSKDLQRHVKNADWFNTYIHGVMEEMQTRHNEGFDPEPETWFCMADRIIQNHSHQLIQQHGSAKEAELLSNTNIIQTVGDMIRAGMENTRLTLEWIFLVIASRPDIQARIHSEMDYILGHSLPRNEHETAMTFTKAVVFETMRLYPAAPFGLPHETMVDSKLDEYDIPVNSLVIFNLRAALQDPLLWGEDSLIFRPERFLNSSGNKLKMPNKGWMPFSIGQRSCLGEKLALKMIFHMVVDILQAYSLHLPEDESLDMKGMMKGMMYVPKPYKLSAMKRKL